MLKVRDNGLLPIILAFLPSAITQKWLFNRDVIQGEGLTSNAAPWEFNRIPHESRGSGLVIKCGVKWGAICRCLVCTQKGSTKMLFYHQSYNKDISGQVAFWRENAIKSHLVPDGISALILLAPFFCIIFFLERQGMSGGGFLPFRPHWEPGRQVRQASAQAPLPRQHWTLGLPHHCHQCGDGLSVPDHPAAVCYNRRRVLSGSIVKFGVFEPLRPLLVRCQLMALFCPEKTPKPLCSNYSLGIYCVYFRLNKSNLLMFIIIF